MPDPSVSRTGRWTRVAPEGLRWATGGGSAIGECNGDHLARIDRSGTLCGRYRAEVRRSVATGAKRMTEPEQAVRLWLDDLRPPPGDEWHWARTADEAIETLRENIVSFASLDHDLGDIRYDETIDESIPRLRKERTGYDVVLWMAEHDVWPIDGISIHSWNPIGGAKMKLAIDRYGPYVTACRHIPDERPWTELKSD